MIGTTRDKFISVTDMTSASCSTYEQSPWNSDIYISDIKEQESGNCLMYKFNGGGGGSTGAAKKKSSVEVFLKKYIYKNKVVLE